MKRLDEIKERTKKGISEYMHDADRAEIHRQDALYLLSLNERYRLALKNVRQEIREDSRGNALCIVEQALEE